ncbi:hypothetical protein GGQ74_001142 [Desulfobaculum xiamenense]|uniref:Uncharacterized protein n=1 Tax=Desulfobaculum xiamenense TaxID=995050 RepID=A0A846QM23_9BACT|nr:hypothetical protein [Desulfobaculum xiamenense]NJB67502.1 hypothetical protein [Desulfobaculum xiamenense]
MGRIETVRIVSEDTTSGFMVINRDDFDPESHTLFGQEVSWLAGELAELGLPELKSFASEVGVDIKGNMKPETVAGRILAACGE